MSQWTTKTNQIITDETKQANRKQTQSTLSD